MDIDLVFKIAATGIIVAVLNQLLIRSGREDQAMMTTLAGLLALAALFAPVFLQSIAYTLVFAAAGVIAGATGQKPCAQLCRLYFEGARLCGSVLVLYFFMIFLSTALLLLAGNGG